MKTLVITLYFSLSVIIGGSSSMNARIGKSLHGDWNLRCPDAGEDFDPGIIKFRKDLVYIEFPGLRETFSAAWRRSINETFSIHIDLNGQRVTCILKQANENTLSGSLVTKYGDFPVILEREGSSYGQNIYEAPI